MNNRKFIAIVALVLATMFGNSIGFAEGSSDLLRMDIKKSGATDAVDVTFYTTGNPSDSVVTRKSDNRYVVLLPNVAGSQSVAPSLGGVKDLVSDVSVKNVDDGIGGYTKVTFTTTKPVKIQTYTKKTAPLTQAQKDYKTLIAENNKITPVIPQQKTQTSTSTIQKGSTTKAPAPQNTNKTPQEQKKNVVTGSTHNTAKTALATQNNIQKPQNAVASKAVTVKPSAKTQPQKAASTQTKSLPKVAQNVSKTVVAPVAVQASKVVKDNVANNKPVAVPVNNTAAKQPDKNISNNSKLVKNSEKDAAIATSKKSVNPKVKVDTHKDNKKLPIFPVAGALSALGIFILLGVINSLVKAAAKNKAMSQNFGSDAKVLSEKNRAMYTNIMNDNSLSWQEKFKQYTQKEEELNKDNSTDISYVTNVGATDSVVLSGDDKKNTASDKAKLQEQIVSQMEHALSQTPSSITDNKTVKPEVYAEDDSIVKKMDSVKLKSFAKNASLAEANRNILKHSAQDRNVKSGRESRFVKLRKSALSVSRRNSLSSKVNISDLARSNNLYDMPISESNNVNHAHKAFGNNVGVTKVSGNVAKPKLLNEENKNYTSTSISDYLDILGTNNNKNSIEFLSAPMSAMDLRKNMTMPEGYVSKKSEKNLVNISGVGLKIRDRYSVDDKTSIYLVDIDGKTSIIGEVDNEVNVVKSFDRIINKPLQVRHDYGNVYICKLDSYKCLVDVSKSKVAALLEI